MEENKTSGKPQDSWNPFDGLIISDIARRGSVAMLMRRKGREAGRRGRRKRRRRRKKRK